MDFTELGNREFKSSKELGGAFAVALSEMKRGFEQQIAENRSAYIDHTFSVLESLRGQREQLEAKELVELRNAGKHAYGDTDRAAVREYVCDLPSGAGNGTVARGVFSADGVGVALWGERTEGGGFRHGLLDDPQPISVNQARAQNEVARALFLVQGARAAEAAKEMKEIGSVPNLGPLTQADVRKYLSPKARARVGVALAEMGPQFRAFAPNSGEGAEVVLTGQTIPGLIRFRDLQDPLVQLFTARQMTMRSDKRARLKSRAQFFRFGDLPSGATEASKLRATQVSFDTLDSSVSPLGVRFLIDWYAEEDAIIDVFDLLRSETMIAMGRTIKDVIINGDTASSLDGAAFTGSGQYGFTRTGVGNDQWHLSMTNGLRKQADATKISLGSDTGASGFRKLLASLDTVYAGAAVHLISHRDLYVNVLAETKLESQETFGQAAVLISGLPSRIYNSRIVPTDAIPINLNASGVYDGSTMTKTVRISLDPSDFELNQKGTTTQAVVVDPLSMSISYMAAFRAGFTKLQPAVNAATNPAKSVVIGYNLPSSI